MARRSKDTWYIGSINDWKMRELEIDLNFLTDGKYQMEIFRDGVNADRTATDYKKETRTLPADKKVKIKMYPGGGYVARIIKSN